MVYLPTREDGRSGLTLAGALPGPGPIRESRVSNALRESSATGALVVAAFCLVVAGPNLPTALLPAYRLTYAMTPFGLSVVFTAYLVLLVPVLMLCARPALRARAVALLPAGLVLAIVADVLMAGNSSVAMLLAGRALSGISVAISTGASAALTVELVGERGRGSVATGNVAGALAGTVAAVLLAQVGIGRAVYLVHAGVTGIITAALLVAFAVRRRARSPLTAAAGRPPAAGRGIVHRALRSAAVPRRDVVLGTLVGAVGWAVPGLVTGLVPALLRGMTGPSAVVVATSPAILLLGAAWIIQVLAKHPLLRVVHGYELTVGTGMTAVGLTVLTAGAVTAQVLLVCLGCVVAAGGPALAYRGGMVLLTRGLDPIAQGAVTSRYAASSYGFAAVVVMGAGALGAFGGMVEAVAIGAGLLAVTAIVLLVVILATEAARHS